MDFGVSLDGLGFLGSPETGFSGSGSGLGSDGEARQRGYGSGSLKQGRPLLTEDEWRNLQGTLKMAKYDDYSLPKTMLLQPRTSLVRSNSEVGFFTNDGFERNLQASSTLPYYHHPSVYSRSSGLGSGSLNSNMHVSLTGIRGPFTPSQWLELEHQALIFKYITANVPVPANLIIPIRKTLNPSGYSGFSAGSLRPNSFGWGSFHLGFSGNNDSEPGRCRRTDGKKWRCSRDAVVDQKYCERHMNRGRHRSRKPVEGQTGHAAAKALLPASSSSASASGSSTTTTDSLAIAQQIKSMQPAADPSATNFSRFLINKQNVDDRMRGSQSLSMLSTVNLKSKDPQFPTPKPHLLSFEDSSRTELESLLNPQRNSYFQTRNFNGSTDLNARESQAQSLRHFMDDWPKNRSGRTTISWPEEEIRMDQTQLSISIPVASSDFSSSSSSPQEKLTLSPLKLSRELDPIQMGLGVGSLNEATQKQANWIPISWGSSMGGPLGEVLNSTNTPKDSNKDNSALNLMTEGWDTSPRLGSSPTGVLQKTSFGSFSNSSTGSSPRAENKTTHENNSLGDDLLGSTLLSSSVPPI